MFQLSVDKFANAVLLALTECVPRPGLTVLIKLLFRADFEHYREHLRPSTGAEYVALERGPGPDDYRAIFRKLVSRGDLDGPEFIEVAPGYRPMECYKPMRRPDLSAFGPSELATLRAVIAMHGRKSGADLSAETHEELPWRAAWREGEGAGERIPYALARWEENRATDADIAAAAEALKRPDVEAALRELDRAAVAR
jgi:hypothetical protein